MKRIGDCSMDNNHPNLSNFDFVKSVNDMRLDSFNKHVDELRMQKEVDVLNQRNADIVWHLRQIINLLNSDNT
jgi:hypothetical protein